MSTDLSGAYVLKAWLMRPLKTSEVEKLERLAPGSMVSLSHEDAERLLALNVVIRVQPEESSPESPKPAESQPLEESAPAGRRGRRGSAG